MKSGMQPGVNVEFRVIVDEDMRPSFNGKIVHNVLSTISMIYYMEKAGREVILPFLEEGEEGAGFAIDVKHLGLAVIGQEVIFKAICTEVTEKRIICEVLAETDMNIVGKGLFTQALFKSQDMEQRIKNLLRAEKTEFIENYENN